MAFDFLSAGFAAIPTIWKGFKGNSQINQGNKILANNLRPTYSRPTEVGQSLALAEQAYLNGAMPGASTARNNISAVGANAFDNLTQGASSSGDLLDGITKIQATQDMSLNDLAIQEAAFKQQQLDDYQRQLATGAGYSDREFGYNYDQPYQDRAAAGNALIEAGNANLGAAIGEGAALGTAIASNQFGKKASQPGQTTSRFSPLSAAASAPLNFTAKKMVFDPYSRAVSSSF